MILFSFTATGSVHIYKKILQVILDDMAGKLGEILIIFIMPVEKRFARIWKNLLQWVITN